jgi:hypothetical protein
MIDLLTHAAALALGIVVGWWARGPADPPPNVHPHSMPGD